MKKLLTIILLLIGLSLNAQTYESNYTVKGIVINNSISKNRPIVWGQFKTPAPSEILVKQKPDGTYYIKMTANGKFGYGGYFKSIGKEKDEYKYLRTDGTANDILLLNFPLSDIAKNKRNMNNIIMKMISYESSYGLLLKF